MPTREIIVGDCRTVLRTLPAGSVHCCVTSPPYFALRSYLPKGHDLKHLEMGSEPTPAEFVRGMVEVFAEVRRVLRDDGVLFVNIGDSYANSGGNGTGGGCGRDNRSYQQRNHRTGPLPEAKPGDLIGVPWLLADALKADGWYLRCDIVWAKRSPMPESINGVRWTRCRVKTGGGWTKETHPGSAHSNGKSQKERTGKIFGSSGGEIANELAAQWSPCPGCDKCRDHGGYVLRRGSWRPTRAHEFVFMLTKIGSGYFCDAQAVQEAATCRAPGNKGLGKAAMYDGHDAYSRRSEGKATGAMNGAVETRNPRSVWHLSSEPCKLAHFATYPTKLILPCIKAATSSAGCCPECGACYAPVVEQERVPTRPGLDNEIDPAGMANRDPQRHVRRTTVKGYLPTCGCNAGPAVPCTVLDPFSGAGTTGIVCKRLGLNYIGIELNPEYAAMARKRIDADCPKPKKPKAQRPDSRQMDLFAEPAAGD